LAKLAADDANVLILDEPTNHLDLWARVALEKAVREFEGTVLFISHDRYFVDCVADHLLIIQPDARFRVLEGNYSTFRHMVSKGLMVDPFQSDTLSAPKSPLPSKPSVQPKVLTAEGTKKAEQDAWKANVKKKEAAKKKAEKQSRKVQKEPLRKEEHWKREQGKGETVPLPGKTLKEKRKRKFPFRKVADIEEEIFARETHIMALNEDLLRPEVARDGDRVRTIHLEIKGEQEKIAVLYEHWEEAGELNW